MLNFIKTHKRSLIVLGLLILATGLSALAAYFPNNTPNSAIQPTTNATASNTTIILPTTTTNSPTIADHTITKNTTKTIATSTEKTEPDNNDATSAQFLSVKMTVGDKIYQLRFTAGEKLIDAMAKLQAMSDQPFSMVTKEYTGMGKFVEEINGLKNNTAENKYWGYYINGTSAPVGASSYILKEGDKIEWKYAQSNF